MIKILDVPVKINWAKFKPGTSFFLPCINHVPVQQAIQQYADSKGMKVTFKRVVEERTVGLRVWRNLDTVPPHSPSLLKDLAPP